VIPASSLRDLRAMGYTLRADRGDIVVKGPPPASLEAFLGWLKANKPALLALLELESHGDRVLVLDYRHGGARHA
jgi:hypothetical protein